MHCEDCCNEITAHAGPVPHDPAARRSGPAELRRAAGLVPHSRPADRARRPGAADMPDLANRSTPAADAMLSRIAVPQALAGGDRNPAPSETASAPAPMEVTPPRGSSSFGDYVFTAPEGWTSTPAGNGLWLASP